MATSLLSPNAKQAFDKLDGTPADGYKLYTYATGTVNPQATYTDRAGLVPNANPIILNARGECVIYLTPGVVYDYVLKSGADVAEWTQAGVSAQAGDASAVNFTQAGTGAIARTLQAKQAETLSATDFAGVDPTGVADSTAGINSALAYAKTVGKRCLLPAGDYKISASIVIPGGTELVGEGWQPYTAYATTGTLGKGSFIHVTHTGSPAVLFQKDGTNRTSGGAIRSLGMYWDHAAPGVGWVPTVYDFALKVDRADDFTAEDVLLVNPYRGIQITGSVSEPAGRLNLSRVYGQPLLVGVEVLFSVDVTCMDRVHFWPYWSDNANVLSWMKANNATFLHSRRNDNCQLSNLFGFGYRYGIQITGDGTGTTVRMMGNNIDFDDTVRGFHVASTAGNSSGSFTNFNAQANPATATADMFVVESGLCDYQFSNLRLSNSQQSAITVNGSGSVVRIHNFWADQYNLQLAANTAVTVGASARVDISQGRYTQANGGGLVSGAGIAAIGEWVTYAPSLAAGTGTYTSASVPTARYRRTGNAVQIELDVSIVTNGTAATSVIVGLPIAAVSPAVMAARERNAAGYGVCGQVLAAGTTVVLTKSGDNSYPGGNSTIITVSGTYEAA